MNIPIQLVGLGKTLPKYHTPHAAASDLCAAIAKPITLAPGQRAVVPTGVALALPDGYEAQIRGRSGLAVKFGISVVHGVGTIDADYRGEIGAILINHGQEVFLINPGDRIVQMIIAKVERANWNLVDSLDETARGAGGFGSTGK